MTTTDAPLPDRQRQILEFIRERVASRGYPPTVREIGKAVGLRSPASVHNHLGALERAGLVRRDPLSPRAIQLLAPAEESLADTAAQPTGTGAGTVSELDSGPARGATVPVVGDIAAGAPILAEEHIDEVVTLPESLVGQGTLFMLRVRGDSMIGDGILDGDLVVVRQQPTVEQGDLCAAMVAGEATVKRYRRTPDGQVRLEPSNPAFEPIALTGDAEASVLGRVVAVLRRV